MHLAAQLFEQAGHDPFAGARDAAADDDQTVDQRHGRRHGVAGDLAHLGESLAGGFRVAFAFSVGDIAEVLRFQPVVRVARQLSVNALYGADRGAVFDDNVGHLLVLEAKSLDARVVAAVEFVVHHDTDAQTRAESVAHQILVAFGAAQRFEPGVHFGQCAAQRFAVGKEVAVVVDEDRNAEFVFEERPQRHAFAERGEVGQVSADDSVRIVGRAGEREADGDGFLLQLVDDGLKTFDHRRQTFVQVVGVRRQRDRR